MTTKVFITVFTVEGNSEIPELSQMEQLVEGRTTLDSNVYKRIAEHCLEISDICADQLVHQFTLNLPVISRNPEPGPLYHSLRHCNISGLFND